MKTPLDIYLQRHSPGPPGPLSLDLWLHGYIMIMITLAYYQHAIPLSLRLPVAQAAGTCPEPVFQVPYIPYLLTYPSGLSPALSSRRRKNTGVNLK